MLFNLYICVSYAQADESKTPSSFASQGHLLTSAATFADSPPTPVLARWREGPLKGTVSAGELSERAHSTRQSTVKREAQLGRAPIAIIWKGLEVWLG